ncbi:hypothetical protein BHM03_00008436 [Ensete ventricosum]|uniref:RING-type E3 ubiquitin transferase n=1 Tax=Ensete ventricosum TaxID=4639 RepID=A0A445MCF9_ENSVE|nr:hypothetical protein BHM03_00008436 [Ensete ventricosum]
MASNPPSFHHHCRSLLPSPSSPPSPHCSFPSPAGGVSKSLPPSRSIPILLPIVFLFFLLLFFLSIFVFRDILHFTYAFFYGGSPSAVRRPTTSNAAAAADYCRRGLDPDILASFPTLPYSLVRGLQEGKCGAECAVCLAEFAGGDVIRLLTVCCHAFHPPCIDSWLAAHATCPVCRCDLKAPPDEAAVMAVREAVDGGGDSHCISIDDDGEGAERNPIGADPTVHHGPDQTVLPARLVALARSHHSDLQSGICCGPRPPLPTASISHHCRLLPGLLLLLWRLQASLLSLASPATALSTAIAAAPTMETTISCSLRQDCPTHLFPSVIAQPTTTNDRQSSDRSLYFYNQSLLPRSDNAMGPRREFARRFAEGIEKLAGNTSGDRWKKIGRLAAKMPETAGLAGGLVFTQRRSVDVGVPQGGRLGSG